VPCREMGGSAGSPLSQVARSRAVRSCCLIRDSGSWSNSSFVTAGNSVKAVNAVVGSSTRRDMVLCGLDAR